MKYTCQKQPLRVAVAVLGVFGLLQGAEPSSPEISPADREFFETHIRPVLAEKCAACHGGERPQGGLNLDFRGGWEQGGKSGPSVIRGNPGGSPLIRAIRHEGPEMAMPLAAEKLPQPVIDAFEEWVRMGAPDPRDAPSAAAAPEGSWEEKFSQRSRWWSLQPVRRPPLPAVSRSAWAGDAVDRFILAKLEEKELSPAPPADRATLLRRLSFVLTGLPPTPGEVAAFSRDPSPHAYATAVERLLSSPHFGERWARHWMDVVRYSDTYGYEWDVPAKGSWRYRDYLIRAFNEDVPVDQLVREQIAGDLLPHPRINTFLQINESLIGPMFFQMGEKRHGDSLAFNGIHQEMLNDKIDAFSKSFQAMTVACARCHDHKLDAISQRDYYALGGVLMSSRWVVNTVDTAERNRKVLDGLSALKPKLRRALASWWLQEAKTIPLYLRAAQACVDAEGNVDELARGLDPLRFAAWHAALGPRPGDEDPLADPLFPWSELNRPENNQTGGLETTWQRLAADYAKARQERSARNAGDFSVIADFRNGVPDGWAVDGVGLRRGAVRDGDFTVALDGSEAVREILPAGLFTHALSPRLNGAVRSPFLNHSGRPYVSFEASGGALSVHRLVPDNAFLTERQGYLENHLPHWTRRSTDAREKTDRALTADETADTRISLELLTKTSNPYFPPRVGLGGCTEEKVRTDNCGAQDPRSWFGITRVVLHDHDESPADELTRFESLFAAGPPPDLPAVAARYREWLTAALEAWAEDRAGEADVWLINWMLDRKLLPNRIDAHDEVRQLVASYRSLEAKLAEPQTVNGMADLDPGRDIRLNVRGVYEDLGDHVQRGYVQVLARGKHAAPKRSGRLDLAELVASPANPLTSRVFVNRVWQWVFGDGIVRTPNDFGHLGDRPSHPELLDYLADWFVDNGWSMKKLVRRLVMSQTFQQSGQVAAAAEDADPRNRLLHHYPLLRLDAEAIRDSLLAVSGGLDRRLFGAPIDPFRTNEDATKRLLSGPLDGLGRRSVYLKMTIMEPSKFLATFNQPAPKIPTGARDVTNVPAQALTLLNDPFVIGQAEVWARNLIAASHDSPQERLISMFRQAFGREPEPREVERWMKAVSDITGLYQDIPEMRPPPGGMMESVAVWQDVAHAMFNAKEFLYVR